MGQILSVGAVENQSEVVVVGTVVAEQGSLSAEGGWRLMEPRIPAAAAAGIEGSAAGIVVGVVAVGIVEFAAGIEDSAAGIGGC